MVPTGAPEARELATLIGCPVCHKSVAVTDATILAQCSGCGTDLLNIGAGDPDPTKPTAWAQGGAPPKPHAA